MSKELETSDYRKFTQGDFEYEKQKSVEPVYFVYQKYVEALKEHRIPLAPDMQDVSLTNFIVRADPETIDKKVRTVLRFKHINKSGDNKGRKTEYMMWFENWRGKDKNGHILPTVSDLPKGIDKGIETSRSTDAEGVDHYKVERDYWFYTVPFSADKLDEILTETDTDIESVQYLVKGIRKWGGFSYDEFKNLTYEELCERGRTGKVNQPVAKIEQSVKIDDKSVKAKK